MDYQSILFGPLYDIHGVPAQLILSDGTPFDSLVAIDKTSGIDTSFGGDVGNVQTIQPAAVLRVQEMLTRGLRPEETPEATLTLNGSKWRVVSYKARPTPNGESDGEVYLILAAEFVASVDFGSIRGRPGLAMAATLSHM